MITCLTVNTSVRHADIQTHRLGTHMQRRYGYGVVKRHVEAGEGYVYMVETT